MLHRGDLLAPSPPWPHLRALHMSGALRHGIAAFAGPARSGGRAVLPGRLPGVCMHAQTRGTPHPVLLMQCLAKAPSADGTARTLVRDGIGSNVFARYPRNAWDILPMKMCGASPTRGGTDCFRRIAIPRFFCSLIVLAGSWRPPSFANRTRSKFSANFLLQASSNWRLAAVEIGERCDCATYKVFLARQFRRMQMSAGMSLPHRPLARVSTARAFELMPPTFRYYSLPLG